MNDIETTFVHTFISRDKRERWVSLLASETGRSKLLHRFAHVFVDDLDPRFVFDKDAVPPDIAAQAKKALDQWAEQNPKRQCYILANNGGVDKQTMPLAEAESDDRLTFGAVLVLIPNRLAYYHTERSNINKQPYYLLFHP